jgi:Uma2 family endonuclease
MSALLKKQKFETMADVLGKLGVPANRVLLDPRPGTATVKDLIRHVDGDPKKLVELVNGTLVEKAMGIQASYLALRLAIILEMFNEKSGDVAMILGSDAMFRLMPKLVRLPDVSLTSWGRIPGRVVPKQAVADFAPDLAVEAISKGNTTKEMTRKLDEYFAAGIRVVWFIYPVKRIVRVFSSPKAFHDFAEGDTLDGGDFLPGFQLPVAKLFEKLGPAEAPKKKRKK